MVQKLSRVLLVRLRVYCLLVRVGILANSQCAFNKRFVETGKVGQNVAYYFLHQPSNAHFLDT